MTRWLCLAHQLAGTTERRCCGLTLDVAAEQDRYVWYRIRLAMKPAGWSAEVNALKSRDAYWGAMRRAAARAGRDWVEVV